MQKGATEIPFEWRCEVKSCFIVYTPNGDYRDIWAYDADGAKNVVFHLTYGRIAKSAMFVQHQ